MSKPRGKKLWVGAGSLVIIGCFVFLLYGGIDSNLVFFRTPAELVAMGDKGYDVPIRLGGMVVPGSVQWDAHAIDLRFKMTDNTKELVVHTRKAPPQMFQEGMGVVVEGRMTRAGLFEADNLMVKHSNEYKAPHDAKKPQDLYKSLVKETKGTD